MKKITLILPLAAALLSCGGGHKPAAADNHYNDSLAKADSLRNFGPPVAIDLSRISDTTLDGKRVVIEGYVRVGSITFNSDDHTSFDLLSRKGEFALKAPSLSVMIAPGEKNNNMKVLPDNYGKEDVIITGNSGEKIGFDEHVKVTGMLMNRYGSAYLNAQTVEKTEGAAFDYSSALAVTPANMNDTNLNGKLVMIEGTLDVPIMTLSGSYTYFSLLNNGKDLGVTVDIEYGNEANQVEPLGKDYSEDDVKIHDKNNAVVNLKKKVRIYGVWSNTISISNERSLSVYAEQIQQL